MIGRVFETFFIKCIVPCSGLQFSEGLTSTTISLGFDKSRSFCSSGRKSLSKLPIDAALALKKRRRRSWRRAFDSGTPSALKPRASTQWCWDWTSRIRLLSWAFTLSHTLPCWILPPLPTGASFPSARPPFSLPQSAGFKASHGEDVFWMVQWSRQTHEPMMGSENT